ncbi:hypothetical protein BDP27DRAFT_534041 [Rhodocollybia butyracea]|uniref:Uncharacterized protein n=1 Tax=Rhodocollybia butyracea TaxID=206335 RepID=A0A9P5U8P7_9AGAR|nr:hypothetical protein BDP27DRAFT_534041 [Rhodocollybia butyracea]
MSDTDQKRRQKTRLRVQPSKKQRGFLPFRTTYHQFVHVRLCTATRRDQKAVRPPALNDIHMSEGKGVELLYPTPLTSFITRSKEASIKAMDMSSPHRRLRILGTLCLVHWSSASSLLVMALPLAMTRSIISNVSSTVTLTSRRKPKKHSQIKSTLTFSPDEKLGDK